MLDRPTSPREAARTALVGGAVKSSATRRYYGWWIVVAAAIGQAVSPGPVAFYSLGVLMEPLTAAHGWNRAQLSLIATVLTVAIFAVMPVIGAAIDRFGPKRVLVPSLLAFGLSLIGTGFASSLLSIYLWYGIVGIACAGANSVPYMHVLSAWFNRRRGLAIGMASAGMGAGFALVPSLTQTLLDRFGVTGTFIGLGLLVLGLGLPVATVLLRDRPRPEQMLASEHATDAGILPGAAQGASVGQALRMPQFWAILAIFVLVAGAIYGVALHLVPAVRAIDPLHDHSILAATFFGLTACGGRILSGYLYDRCFVPYVAAGIFLSGSVGVLLLACGLTHVWPLIAALLLGYCSGAEGDALAMLCSRYFGLRAYGKIYGHAFSATLVGISTLPYLLGVGYDHFRGYTEVFYAMAALLALSAALTLCLGPFPVYDASGRRVSRTRPPS